MTKTVFSRTLQKDVILDDEAVKFYDEFDGPEAYHYRQGLDAADYVTLVELGYRFPRDRNLFSSSGQRLMARKITANRIRPEIAEYAMTYLRDYGHTVSDGTWFAEALGALDPANIPKVTELEQAGWDHEHAIIIAAFPEREERMKEIVANKIQYYDIFFGTDYDLAMVARLLKVPGAYFIHLKSILDKGFTEAEIKGFGYPATKYFSVEELRSVSIKPSFFKNIVSALPLDEWLPSISEVEALHHAGINNGKQYKAFARALGLRIANKETLDTVTIVANILSIEDATKIFSNKGTATLAEVKRVEKALLDGYTVDEYLIAMDAADSSLEDYLRLNKM